MDEKKSWRSSVGILQNGQSWGSLHREITPRHPSSNSVNASVVAFVAMIFLIISFTSPYWLQSYEKTYSDFSNMGLWEFCFNGFRYPKNQIDIKFMGCNYIFSFEYRIIWEWILPAWFMATQAFMTLALLFSMASLMTMSLVLIRWPLKYVMRFEWHMIGLCFCCEAVTVLSMALAVLVFGVMCWSRDWLLNPNFNYLSWSYAFAVISGCLHAFAALMLLYETYEARDRKREACNLLQMHDQAQIQPAMVHTVNQGYI